MSIIACCQPCYQEIRRHLRSAVMNTKTCQLIRSLEYHLTGGVRRSKDSPMPHCRVLPLGEFTGMITRPVACRF